MLILAFKSALMMKRLTAFILDLSFHTMMSSWERSLTKGNILELSRLRFRVMMSSILHWVRHF